jgi:dCTP deaminase
MSILTKSQILKRVEEGNITFYPVLDQFQIQAHAVDLRLGFTFLLPKNWHLTKNGRESLKIDYFDKNRSSYFDIIELEQGQFFELLPGEYVLVSTLESIKIPNDLMAVLYPRSSTNRKGLSVDLTGIVDSGYEGQLAIPVRNNTESQVIKLYPGERFCQVVFDQLDQEVEPRVSRYHKKDIIDGVIRAQGKGDDMEIKMILKGTIREFKEKYKIKLSSKATKSKK